MRRKSLRFVCPLLIALLLVSCNPSPTATLLPTATSPPTLAITVVAIVTATPTALPTFTSTATVMPAATATPIAEPTATLEPALSLVETLELYSLPGTGRNPSALAILGERLCVANWDTNNVSLIEGGRVVDVVPVGSHPAALAVDPAEGRVYVANSGDDSISVVTAGRVVVTWETVEEPGPLALVDGRLYVGSKRSSTIYVHDGESGEPLGNIPVGSGFGILAMVADIVGQRLYVSTYNNIHIVGLEAQARVDTASFKNYRTLAMNPLTGRVYINDYDPDEGQQYLVALGDDIQKIRGRALVGSDPGGAVVNPLTGRVYVTSTWSDTVTVIDEESNEIVATIGVGRRPDAIAVDVETNTIYVANAGSNNINVIDGATNRVINVIPLAIDIGGLAVDSRMDRLYVTITSMDRLAVWEKGKVVGEILVGRHPTDVAVNEMTGRIYVVNHVDSSLSVVDAESRQVVAMVPLNLRPHGISVDTGRNVIYAGDAVIDGDTNEIIAHVGVPTAYRSVELPVDTLVDSASGRLFVRAYNGVPGSNAGLFISMWDAKTLEMLARSLGGLSAGAMAYDPATQKLYSVATRFSYTWLYVDDVEGMAKESEMRLERYPTALALRFGTHHLFLGLGESLYPAEGDGYLLRVLDTRSLGLVADLALSGRPIHIAVNQRTGKVYVADENMGVVHVVQDVPAPLPPSPTPSVTPVS